MEGGGTLPAMAMRGIRSRGGTRAKGGAASVLRAFFLLPMGLAAGLVLLAWGGGDARARTPVVRLLELAEIDGVPPPVCPGVAVRARSLRIDPALAVPGTTVRLLGGVARLEDAGHALLVRRQGGCLLLFAARWSEIVTAAMDVFGAPARRWRMADWSFDRPEGFLSLPPARAAMPVAPGRRFCLPPAHGIPDFAWLRVPAARARAPAFRLPPPGEVPDVLGRRCRTMLVHYGRREVHRLPSVSVSRSVADDRPLDPSRPVEGRFSGPGDCRTWRLRVGGPGLLLVDYRSEAGAGALDVTIMDARGRPLAGMRIAARDAARALRLRVCQRAPGAARFFLALHRLADGEEDRGRGAP